MPLFDCLCFGEDGTGAGCLQCTLESDANPKGMICETLNAEIDSGFEVDQGMAFSISNRLDVSFTKIAISTAFNTATEVVQGISYLKCQICGNYIDLNAKGKEEWVSYSGKPHETRPHIDHHAPDWADRKAGVEKMADYISGDVSKKKQLLNNAYNHAVLRVAHRLCNLKK
jgi:hypothetical protein